MVAAVFTAAADVVVADSEACTEQPAHPGFVPADEYNPALCIATAAEAAVVDIIIVADMGIVAGVTVIRIDMVSIHGAGSY